MQERMNILEQLSTEKDLNILIKGEVVKLLNFKIFPKCCSTFRLNLSKFRQQL